MTLQHTYTFEAIGTLWTIETDIPLVKSEVRHIHKQIDDFDRAYSRFRSDSLVSRARLEAPDSFVFPSSIVELYDTYVELERVTSGAVNPLVGDTLERLGYDAHYSLRPSGTIAQPTELARAITRSGTTLTYYRPVLLDIGAIGRGYLVDMIAEYIVQHHSQYVIDAGGDIAISTTAPYIVGLEHPLSLSQVVGTVSLQNKSICGSSPNRRSWGKGLHHIINATTGQPLQSDITATWAIAKSTILADALATALFFVPAAALHERFGEFQYIIMREDAYVEHTITDIGELFTGGYEPTR